MKKLSLLLLLPLLTTYAYSGGGDDSSGDDNGFVYLVAPKPEKPMPAFKAEETVGEDSAGDASPDGAETDASAKTDPEKLYFDLCAYCKFLREQFQEVAKKTSEGAKQQWDKVPVAFPCLEPCMEEWKKRADELLKELRKVVDKGATQVKKYREDGVPFFKREESDDNTKVARLEKMVEERDEKIAEQEEQLKRFEKVHENVEMLGKLLEGMKQKSATE